MNKKAFSTPELLMTILVFSFGILPLVVLFQTSNRQTASAKNLMVAHSLGRTIISEVKAYGFDMLEHELNSSSLGLIHANRPVEGKMVPEDENSITYPEYYNRFYTSLKMERATTEHNNKIRVELEVEWQEQGRRFNLGFGTVVTKYGI